MPKRMLIDASHPEETRVVVLDGQKVEEFDFEAASKRPLKGNIYLAKVTRVEPSLQAAFVEYGGNRQGFLAFSEIHPDYYQIPVADRMALIAEQEADARHRQEDDFESFEIGSGQKAGVTAEEVSSSGAEEASVSGIEDSDTDKFGKTLTEDDGPDQDEPSGADTFLGETDQEERSTDEDDAGDQSGVAEALTEANSDDDETFEPEDISTREAATQPSGVEPETGDAAQPLQAKRPSQRWMRRRHYKIQEVIKRRQIILVQVVKEERGNKGAALTTYLSLAGRYCVLMPNTPRGGGISRKITNANDRKRLKSAAQTLELPEGMGLIIRTAGENRTKVEIKRDYEYLLRLWDTIRELTLKSNAPACVYEEGDLIKRAIRDLYNKDVSEVVVEGDGGYHNAKDFMRMLMPSHAKNVKSYKEAVPLFQHHHIEAQLDAMFQPTITLKSGGYIVVNQTEALVAIDVNSGRATREHSIEDTATKTNLEAADEIGRQLRLRDLAGLIVIDFIDMEDSRNDRTVEKRIHNAVKNDRARVQIGKISQFGLLEMSRQRLRAGVVAGSTVPCPHCGGQGIVRSVESTSLRVLRGLEEEAQRQRADGLVVRVATDVVIYTLNQKRRELARLESEYDIAISFDPKEGLKAGDFDIERVGQRDPETRPKPVMPVEVAPPAVEAEAEPEIVEEIESAPSEDTMHEEIPAESRQHLQPGDSGSRRRRRRRRRGGRDRDHPLQGDQRPEHDAPQIADGNGREARSGNTAGAVEETDKRPVQAAQNGESPPSEQQGQFGEGRRRRRRRRRGRRGGRDRENIGGEQRADGDAPASVDAPVNDRYGQPDEIDTTPREEPRNLPEMRPAVPPEAIPNAASTPVWSLEVERTQPPRKPVAEKVQAPEPPAAPDAPPRETAPQPSKKGWWQRAFRTD
ncbi:MAG: Rne/Rng family ribonuclease [Alphaproteobacteria bacterium]|nr:Rne/Rng family ribonuclease [Alphaproteobacteria bacterium]MDE2630809.1 Rne/Rng family ribonuclease [Alphaproteobacteria bacterium]